ncbi:PKD domain-containing protein [Spongisporangium articulatum]|uniref:PKD domain-containing protein n=1 Tax=Spongisporangium articulatum TaxID=3362603 RepID=A0ABW8ATN6_9ACTN
MAATPGPINVNTSFDGNEAETTGQKHVEQSFGTNETLPTKPRTWTSHQAICSTKATLATADACHRSTTLCPDPDQAPYWVMTARGIRRPGPGNWTNTGRFVCLTDAENPEPVLGAAQFRKLPIPAAALNIQPDPDTAGPTLVNIATNLYTTRKVQLLDTTVLGQPVRVRATPASYAWTYGDGESLTTRATGGPYPDLSLGHVYARPGHYEVGLATTFTGEYSVAGGPWQPVEGTAVVASDPRDLTVLQARSQLTS